ncbi:divergent protein kinase domain 1A-like isoform X2 [Branchiostoma floridae x Branchiostoma japonicum]
MMSPTRRRAPYSWGQARMPMKIKTLVVIWLVIFIGSWAVYFKYSSYTELCREDACRAIICDRYHKGIITGPLCPALCDDRTITLNQCLSSHPANQVYQGWLHGAKQIIMKCNLAPIFHDGIDREMPYERPEKGSSMDDFREMLQDFLERNLGKGEHNALQTRILNAADINNDGKVTLAEAKSIWALLQVNEFFMMMILQDSEHTPKLEGFCGDTYFVQRVDANRLYGIHIPWMFEIFLPTSYRQAMDQWFTPSWPKKAKIAVGLLEFVEEIFDSSHGTFHMCKTSHTNIGYTNKHDLKMIDLRNLYPAEVLKETLTEKTCSKNSDCELTEDCSSMCDETASRCTGELVQPNLSKICVVLHDYLLKEVPAGIKDELTALLDKCSRLTTNTEDMQIHHSLILNNLKSLLWKQISDNQDS